jgi:DNA-directed RNA polymerase specialized sigma24 family protein
MAKWPRFDPDADRRLVTALSEGNEAPLAALYDIYAERLRDYCGLLIHESRVATDIVHDTLIDAGRRVRRMRDRERLRAWLYAAVRRRCLQRVRHPTLRWVHGDRDSVDLEARELLEAAFARLDFVDQEALLLALRHDLDGEDLGALLGIPARRAAARIARAEARAEAALSMAQLAAAKRCAYTAAKELSDTAAAAKPPDTAATAKPPSDAALTEHVAECADCLRRDDLSLAALLDLMPAPALPASLRHRVVHTGTDPELAGYRADIAARGGTLNADGLPRQPDIPSRFTRRWMFTSGGIVGALLATFVAILLIGPGTPIPGLIWPPDKPTPSKTPAMPTGRPPMPEAQPPAGGAPAVPSEAVPQADERQVEDRKLSPTATADGVLVVMPTAIDLGRQENVAKMKLHASGGRLSWQASTSTNKIMLSADEGSLDVGEESIVTLTFQRGLITLPGQETITFTDSGGLSHRVVVTWDGTLL